MKTSARPRRCNPVKTKGIMDVVGGEFVSLVSKKCQEPPRQQERRALPRREDANWECCAECGLPVGSKSVAADEGFFLHGECAAHLLLKSEKEFARQHRAKDVALKKAKRAQYDIGWKVENIPHYPAVAEKLGHEPDPHGMYCLRYAEAGGSAVSVMPTSDPTAAVNLEYLAVALKVRMEEGRECLFSLDPKIDGECPEQKHKFQVKRFEPAWLAGTRVGEVLCQADIYLKELSMGEYPQPVAIMKSAFDLMLQDETTDWSAREWFMVKKASVHVQDGVLVPLVEMGVEARAQVKNDTGFHDAPVTSPDHPLVKYAEMFTHYFDLIAERKSVVFNLREVARASALAKFIVESELEIVEDAWLALADAALETCCLEVPQLWNERRYSHWGVDCGKVEPGRSQVVGVYGGVNLGLDSVSGSLFSAKATQRRVGASVSTAPRLEAEKIKIVPVNEIELYPGQEYVDLTQGGMYAHSGPPKAGDVRPMQPQDVMRTMTPTAIRGMGGSVISAALGAEGSQVVPFSSLSRGPPRFIKPSVGLSAISGAVPRGVDLNLNMFDLTVQYPGSSDGMRIGSWANCLKTSSSEPVGYTFWSDIEASSHSAITESDRCLLRRVYHSCLSDRRDEAGLFKLPQTSASYVRKLQKLVDEEGLVHEQRKAVFASVDFQVDSPGSLFPSSWVSPITGGRTSLYPVALYSRSDYHYQTEVSRFARILPSLTPFFDNLTEDGARFRIYQTGTLQVRTVTEKDGQEQICAFLSKHPTLREPVQDSGDHLDEGIERVTQYVDGDAGNPQFFVVIDTLAGNHIITERRAADNPIVWEVNPPTLEARIALAKVTRCLKPKVTNVSAGDVQACLFSAESALPQDGSRPGLADFRAFAEHAFDMAVASTSRSWAGLTSAQRDSIAQLGISEKQWDMRGIGELGLSWEELDEIQRHHALVAGFDADSWAYAVDQAKP